MQRDFSCCFNRDEERFLVASLLGMTTEGMSPQKRTVAVRCQELYHSESPLNQSCGALGFFFCASAVHGGTTPTERE
jgi:hypothetical protein